MITAIKVGVAVIQATMSGCSGSSSVAVEPLVKPVAAVAVSVDSVSLAPGSIARATATPTDPSGTVVSGQTPSWRSLAPSIASVSSSGTVTALATGQTLIEANVAGTTGTVKLNVVAPASLSAPAPAPAPAPSAPTDGSPADLISVDFEDGTTGALSGGGALDGDIRVINDPTGGGRGKVLSLHYKRDATESPGVVVDRNRSVEYRHALRLGQTLFFRGEVYFDVSNLAGATPIQRKLLYWQPHVDYWKYGGAGGPDMASMLTSWNGNGWVEASYIDATGDLESHFTTGAAGAFQAKRWHVVEKQMTMNSSLDSKDGIIRIWVDGALVFERTNVGWTDSRWVGKPVRQGNGTGLDVNDIYFERFLVGEQVNWNQAYDEYRYWNNISFSTKRISR